MAEAPFDRLREVCRTLPEAVEGATVHHPNLNVRGKPFVIFANGDGRDSLWIKSTAGEQAELVASDPDRFFVPPYLGPRGWAGVRVDGDVDWDEVGELVTDAYRLAAPKRLVRQLES